jgi:hypothetical protein
MGRSSVDVRFRLVSKRSVGFDMGPYDHSKPLIIDPTVSYVTYLGGGELTANPAARIYYQFIRHRDGLI